MLFFDNVSDIKKKASDMFGGAYAKRKQYTDGDQYIMSFRRMGLFTALEMPSAATDFLDRCITLEMERIENPVILTELMKQFNEDLPSILGGCLDTIVKAKRLYPDIQIDGLPRLADFGKWGAAVAKALGYDPQKFVDILKNRINAHKSTAVMEQKPAVKAIVEYIDDHQEFKGYTTELFNALKEYCPYRSGHGRGWPPKANGLGMIVSKSIRNRNLKNIGIIVERITPKEGTYLKIYRECIDAVDLELGQVQPESGDGEDTVTENAEEHQADEKPAQQFNAGDDGEVSADETQSQVKSEVEEDIIVEAVDSSEDGDREKSPENPIGIEKQLSSFPFDCTDAPEKEPEKSSEDTEDSAEPQNCKTENSDDIDFTNREMSKALDELEKSDDKNVDQDISVESTYSAEQLKSNVEKGLYGKELVKEVPTNLIRCCNCSKLNQNIDYNEYYCIVHDIDFDRNATEQQTECDDFDLDYSRDIIKEDKSEDDQDDPYGIL